MTAELLDYHRHLLARYELTRRQGSRAVVIQRHPLPLIVIIITSRIDSARVTINTMSRKRKAQCISVWAWAMKMGLVAKTGGIPNVWSA